MTYTLTCLAKSRCQRTYVKPLTRRSGLRGRFYFDLIRLYLRLSTGLFVEVCNLQVGVSVDLGLGRRVEIHYKMDEAEDKAISASDARSALGSGRKEQNRREAGSS